jgi:hypothetical protein
LEADRDAPRVDNQAKLCHFPVVFPVTPFAHFAVRLHVEFDDQSGDEVHAEVAEQSADQDEEEEGDDSDLVDAVGDVEHACAHGAGQQCEDGAAHGSLLDAGEIASEEGTCNLGLGLSGVGNEGVIDGVDTAGMVGAHDSLIVEFIR